MKTREQWLEELKNYSETTRRECLAYDADILAGIMDITISRTDEAWCAGDFHYAISSGDKGDFWLDAFKTKPEAVAFCKTMGWPIAKEEK
jgi:hypothetical protein